MRSRALRKKHIPVDKSVFGVDTKWEDDSYLKWIRQQECVVTGFRQTEYSSEAVDPCHIRDGWVGKSRPHDFHVLPVRHSHHLMQDREVYYWTEQANEHPWLLMSGLRALAVTKYLKHRLGDAEMSDRQLVAAVVGLMEQGS